MSILTAIRPNRRGLAAPRRQLAWQAHYDPEAFGRFSEAVARVIGTARFLVAQSVVIVIWLIVNAAVPQLRFDEYPFILLTLALSLQAAYAAPLILLAQTRQAERERIETERDRRTAERTQAEADFLAREVAQVRLSTGEMETGLHELRQSVDRLTAALGRGDVTA